MSSDDTRTMKQFKKIYTLFLSAIVAVMILTITIVSTKELFTEYGEFYMRSGKM